MNFYFLSSITVRSLPDPFARYKAESALLYNESHEVSPNTGNAPPMLTVNALLEISSMGVVLNA